MIRPFLFFLFAAGSFAASKPSSLPSGELPPVVRTISGNPLTINVGGEASFQILNSAVPGSGQIYPSDCMATADSGVFARIAGTLYTPNFADHPCGSATGGFGTSTPWTAISLTPVTGNGTPADPFQVVAVVDAGTTGVRLTLTVRYVNGQNFFSKILSFSSASAITFDAFLGSDLYLANSDNGVPFRDANSGSVGGQTCPPAQPYTILHIPLTPAQRYSARAFSQVWTDIGSGSLSNIVGPSCVDNGAALQWQSLTASPGAPAVVQAATSFGTIPTITQFRLDSVSPNQGAPGQNVTVTISGLGFQAGTTFNFGAGLTAATTSITSSTQASVTLSIATGAAPGFRDVMGTQSSGGLTHTLTNGFRVEAACVLPAAPVNPRIAPVGNPNGPVTGTDFLNLSWSPPSAPSPPPTSYQWAINGGTFSSPTTSTTATAPPRGSNDPIVLMVRARGCVPEQPGPVANSPTYSPAAPTASFSVSPSGTSGMTFTFTDTSSPQATSWLWLFGDGQIATTQSTTHTYASRGNYTVALIASNGAGANSRSQTQAAGSVSAAPARLTTLRGFGLSEPGRRRLSGVRIGRPGTTWLHLSSPEEEEEESVVYLRFLDENGDLALERRLSLAPGQEALYDVGAFGLTGTFTLELVGSREFTALLSAPVHPVVGRVAR